MINLKIMSPKELFRIDGVRTIDLHQYIDKKIIHFINWEEEAVKLIIMNDIFYRFVVSKKQLAYKALTIISCKAQVLHLPIKKLIMVVGNGLVANGFKAYNDNDTCLVFASGVSNSSSTDNNAFARERDLLRKTIKEYPGKTLIYCSTCSIYDPSMQDSPYVKHKLAIETIVKEEHDDYHIFRISNLVGRTDNPHTVLNFFIQHIISGHFFFLWKNASRNIIDIDDAVAVCDWIIQQQFFKNEVVNVANPVNYKVTEIIQAIETFLEKKGNYELVDKGINPDIDIQTVKKFFAPLNIQFDKDYFSRILKKYYTVK